MENPLFAERYHDDLVEHMVDLVLQNDPLATDEEMKDIVEDTRVEGLAGATDATDRQREGLIGPIQSDFDLAFGEALLLNGTLFLSPDFEAVPGPNLHIMLSTVLDPRDGSFPDEAAVDLGAVNPFGAQALALPADAPEGLRTLVLYDLKLKRIYGFAQLSARR